MKLSDFLSKTTEIISDGNFLSLGTFFSHNPQQVVYAVHDKEIEKIRINPFISCVITTSALVPGIPQKLGVAATQDPHHEFTVLQSRLSRYPEFSLQPFPNQISSSAKIHPSAIVAPQSVRIGRDVVIEKNVRINEQTIIDDGAIIRSNSSIGNSLLPSGETVNTPFFRPAGGVHLHREVDIHANNQINSALFKGYTEIGEQTKLDNLNRVGQGTIIGKRGLICAGVIIGESTFIGDDVWIGPNVTLDHQIRVGNNVYITIGSTVSRDMDDNKVVKDNYAIDRKRFRNVIRGM
jgi:UDP-3-O-[3-hydroxymyristoyl] glucosamine N-acyltransferase